MNEEITARFLSNVDSLQDAAAYASCFPYQSLLTDALITLFYTFYGLTKGCVKPRALALGM